MPESDGGARETPVRAGGGGSFWGLTGTWTPTPSKSPESPERSFRDEDGASPATATATAPRTDPSSSASSSAPGGSVNNLKMGDLASDALRPFAIVSTSYLLFTVTDGAVRMIVLLHAYNKGFSALEVAGMFSLYELAGAVTNLAAGFMGARWGIKLTLVLGLALQLASYGMLFGWRDDWSKTEAIVFVTFAQLLAGVAKDLTKLGGKTVTKLVTPDGQNTRLFKLVSLITGWKNSLKGLGYFLGSALLQVGYGVALGSMMGLIVLAIPWAVLGLDSNLGTARKTNATWREVFVMNNRSLNILSLARLFLFASRDFWFEVPLPFYLRSPSCDGLGDDACTDDADCTPGAMCELLGDGLGGVCANPNDGGGCGGLGLSRTLVGSVLGGYIILYGQVQSWTPQLVTGPLGQTPPNRFTEVLWGMLNCVPTLVMGLAMALSPTFQDARRGGMAAWFVSTIVVFAVIFAVNSSIHSYLVVAYAKTDKLAVSVGFYYMSNALGRLFGTIGSGLLFTYVGESYGRLVGHNGTAGMAACFLAGTLCSVLAAIITSFIDDETDASGLRCGPCVCVASTVVETDEEVAEGARKQEDERDEKGEKKDEGS